MQSVLARRQGRPSGAMRWCLALATLTLMLSTGPARAALFNDDEARKAILDLRSRVQANDEAHRQQLSNLQQSNAELIEQLQLLRRTLVDLTGQLEAQRSESAKLRGSQEQIARDLAETQRQLKEAQAAMDGRLKLLEPQQITLDGQTFAAANDERKAYDGAMGALRTADFESASRQLEAFLNRYPASGYVHSARFWLGNAQYGLKQYKQAIATFQSLLTAAPGHLRAPEAMLALANSQAESRDVKAARRTIDELLKAHPDTEAATAAKERLAALKG